MTSEKLGRVPFIGMMVTWLFGMHPVMYPLMYTTYGGRGCASAASDGMSNKASVNERMEFFMVCGRWVEGRVSYAITTKTCSGLGVS
jgi:hypothetical protein